MVPWSAELAQSAVEEVLFFTTSEGSLDIDLGFVFGFSSLDTEVVGFNGGVVLGVKGLAESGDLGVSFGEESVCLKLIIHKTFELSCLSGVPPDGELTEGDLAVLVDVNFGENLLKNY